MFHIVLLLGAGTSAYSQLQPLMDQYHLNGLAINPAYAGSQEALLVELYSRNQWVGFEGAPRTYTLSMHAPMRNRRVNLGIILLGDKLGSERETGVLLNYAFRISLGRGKWSLGLGAGISNLATDLNALRYTDQGDRLIQDIQKSVLLPEFSIGSYYYTDKFFAGISMPLFLSYHVNDKNGQRQMYFRPGEATYMLTSGYHLILAEGIGLLPSVLVKAIPGGPAQLDLHCHVILREKVWFGAGIRSNGTLSGLFQVQVNPQFRIAYSYSYELSELSSYQHGSHELYLQYRFRYRLDVMSPRYF